MLAFDIVVEGDKTEHCRNRTTWARRAGPEMKSRTFFKETNNGLFAFFRSDGVLTYIALILDARGDVDVRVTIEIVGLLSDASEL